MSNAEQNGNSPAMATDETIDTKNSMGHGTKRISHLGMTKREQFAMAAMQGLMSSAADKDGQWTWGDPRDLVDQAVICADALLAALEANNE